MTLKTVRDPTLPSVPPEEEKDDFERITRFRKGQLTAFQELQENVHDDLEGCAFLAGRAGGQKLIGGTTATDSLKLQGTSGNGDPASPAIQLLVGNNGNISALTILNNGNVGIGTTGPTKKLVVDIGGTGTGDEGIYVSSAKQWGTTLCLNNTITDGTNWMITSAGGQDANAPLGALVFHGAGLGTRMVIQKGGNVGIGTVNPAAKLEVAGSILLGSNFAYTEAITYRQLNIGSGGLINTDISDHSKVLFHNDLSANSIEWGLSSLVDMLDYTETGPAEKAALVGIIRNKVGSTAPNLVDGVGVLGQGTIVGTTTGRAWGLLGEAICPNAADDGLLIGVELGVYNAGTVPTNIDDTLAKVGLWLSTSTTAPYNGATAAIAFANTTPAWVYGMHMRGVKDTFIRMSDPGAGAAGIDMKNNANWVAAMRLPNAVPVYIYDGAGSPKNILYLSSGGVLVIGSDLTTGKLQINVDGTGRFVSLGAPDSGGPGYRYLRVPNA